MMLSWIPAATCALLVLLSVVGEASAFLIPPAGFYWSAPRLYPRYATRLRSPQTEVTALPPQPAIPLTFRQPRQNQVSSVRTALNEFARSALPIRQPFSPWRGKRGGADFRSDFDNIREFPASERKSGDGAFPPMIGNDREFPEWRGMRGSSDFPPMLVNDREFPEWRGRSLSVLPLMFGNRGNIPTWRGKRSTFRNIYGPGENTGVNQKPTAGQSLSGRLECHSPSLMTVENTELHYPLLPPGDLQEFQKHTRSKRSLQKESNNMPKQFTNLDLKSSSHLSDLPPGKEGAESREKAGQGSGEEHALGMDIAPSHLVDDVTVIPRTNNEESDSGSLREEPMTHLEDENVHVETSDGDITSNSREIALQSHDPAAVDFSDPYSEEGWMDWDEGLNRDLLTGSQWHHQLQVPNLGAQQPDSGLTHLQDDPDFPTRVYDHSQPGVGPFFWVETLPESDSFPDKALTADTFNHALLQNDSFKNNQGLIHMKLNNLLFSQGQGDLKPNNLLSVHGKEKMGLENNQHPYTFSMEDSSKWAKGQGVTHRSTPHMSSAKMDLISQKGKTQLKDFSPQKLQLDSAVPQGHKTPQYWTPVFRNQFPQMRRHRLPLSVGSPLQTHQSSHASQTSRADSRPVPGSPPPQLARNLLALGRIQDSQPLQSFHHSPLMQTARDYSFLDQTHREWPLLPDLASLQPLGRAAQSHQENQPSSTNKSLQRDANKTLSQPQTPDASINESLSMSHSPHKGNTKTKNTDVMFDAVSNQATEDNEMSAHSASDSLERVLKSIHDLKGALPFSELGPDDDRALSKVGAGLVGSQADMVKDIPDGQRVIKYQEFAALTSRGGISLTADTQGHVTIAVDSFVNDGNSNATKDTMMSGKKLDHNDASMQQQNPLFFTFRNVSVKITDRSHALTKSDHTDSSMFDQSSSDLDVSSDSPGASFQPSTSSDRLHKPSAVNLHSVLAKSNTSSNRIVDPSQSDTGLADTIRAHSFKENEPNIGQKLNNRHSRLNRFSTNRFSSSDHETKHYEDRSLPSNSDKHNSKLLNPHNSIQSPNKAMRTLTLFQTFPVQTPPGSPSPNRPRKKRSAEGTFPLPNSRERGRVLMRRRREAESLNLSNTPSTSTQMANVQSPILENDQSKNSFTVQVDEHKNTSVSSNHEQKQHVAAEKENRHISHYNPTEGTANVTYPVSSEDTQGTANTTYPVSSEDTEDNKGADQRAVPNKAKENLPNVQVTDNLPKKTKRFMTRGTEQTAMKEMHHFDFNNLPSIYHHKANPNRPPNFAKSNIGAARHVYTTPQWKSSNAKNYPVSEPYIFHSGRTFKPNWYFANREAIQSLSRSKPRTLSRVRPFPEETTPQNRPPATPQESNGSVATNAVHNVNASTQNPSLRLFGIKNGNGRTTSTDRLLRNLSQLFRINFNIQFQSLRPRRSFHNQSQPQAMSLRQQRTRQSWPKTSYNAYALFPMGNIAWANFLYYKHLPPRKHPYVARYKLG